MVGLEAVASDWFLGAELNVVGLEAVASDWFLGAELNGRSRSDYPLAKGRGVSYYV